MTVHNRVYHMKQNTESGSCFGLPVNGNLKGRYYLSGIFVLFSDKIKARKGVGDVMGGNVLELESDRLIQQGVTRGEEQQALKSARLMLIDGKLSLEEISRFSGLEQERIKQLKKEENL